MPYISTNDLLTQISSNDLAKLCGDPTGANIDEIKVGAAIASADSLINAYLSGRYAISESTNEHLIKHISTELTIFNLYSYKYVNSFVPSEILSRKLDAIKLLDDIYRGKIIINSIERINRIHSNQSGNKYFRDENLEEFRNYRE